MNNLKNEKTELLIEVILWILYTMNLKYGISSWKQTTVLATILSFVPDVSKILVKSN